MEAADVQNTQTDPLKHSQVSRQIYCQQMPVQVNTSLLSCNILSPWAISVAASIHTNLVRYV